MRDFWEFLGFDSDLYSLTDPQRLELWPEHMKPQFELQTTEFIQMFFIVALSTAIIGFMIYSLWRTITHKDVVPWLFLLGGFLQSLQEPIFDQVDYLAMTVENTLPVWVVFDCIQPVFVPLFYMVILGIAPYCVFRSLQSGRLRTRKQLLLLHIGFTCIEFAGEIVAIKCGIFQYSGFQPFPIVPGAPLWIAVVNGALILVVPYLVWKLHPEAGQGKFDWRWLAIPWIMCVGLSIIAFGCTWPIQFAFSFGYPAGVDPVPWIYVGAIISMMLSITLYSYLTRDICGAGYFDGKDAEKRTDKAPTPLKVLIAGWWQRHFGKKQAA